MRLHDDMRGRWFLVMQPGDANRPGPAWFGVGAGSRGRIAIRPIAPQGWLSLAAFAAGWVLGGTAIWVGGYGSGAFSPAFAIMATALVTGIVIAGFIRLVVTRMTELPPPEDQPR